MSTVHSAVEAIARCGLIAAMRGGFTAESAIRTCDALFAEGINVFEFTMNSAHPIETLTAVRKEFDGRAIVGMGTVLDAATARRVIDAGADFLLSPGSDLEVIDFVHQQGKLMCPGVFTPTEALAAWKAGAKLLKLFPVGPIGVPYLKSMLGPLGHMKFLCDGGMNLENVPTFISAGATACGLVEALTGDGSQPAEEIRRRARELVRSVAMARSARIAQETNTK